MVMMAVVVAVRVGVDDPFMGVLVGMAFEKEQAQRESDHAERRDLEWAQAFSQPYHGEEDPEERGSREHHLRSRCSEGLGGRDVENDARAIGNNANSESGGPRQGRGRGIQDETNR